MNINIPRQGGVSWTSFFQKTVLCLGMAWGASTVAHAAAPPAGASITNQASASYKDSSGLLQKTTSNAVVTTVSQVGAFTLLQSSNAKRGAPGVTVFMPYVLTNTGNGADDFTLNASETNAAPDFSKIELYLDNGEGQPASATPLCSATTPGTVCSHTTKLEAGVSLKFVAAYTIPGSATAAWQSNTGTVTVTPASGTNWYSTYSPNSESRTDTVTFDAGVVFDVSVSIKAPQIAPVSGTWPVATSGPGSTYTTYTITYVNKGAQSGHLFIHDELPAGLTYQTGQSVHSCAGATALSEAAGGDTAVCSSLPNIEFEYDSTSKIIKAVIPGIQAGGMGTLSFKVQVGSTAAIGTSQTTNKVKFTAQGCSANSISLCNSSTLTESNSAEFTVTATRSVSLNTVDTTPGTPASSTDGFTSQSIVAGSYVQQPHRVSNTGNGEDAFNLTVAQGTFPANTVFAWFHADGATPLLDTNSDGVVDTGLMAAGANKDVVLQITVPPSTTVSTTANLQATALATSVSSSAVKDASFANVTRVMGGFVDLTSTAAGTATAGDIGPGPGSTPALTTTAVAAGSGVHQLALYIRNNDSSNNTFSLASSSQNSFPGNLPAGWSVVFSSTACSSTTAITQIAVTAGQQATVYACVNSPPNSPTVVQPIFFKVTSTQNTSTGATASDVLYEAVSVVSGGAYRMTLQASSTGSALKGASTDYAHNLTNSGTASCGAGNNGTNYLKVTAVLPQANLTAGWTSTIYLDADNSSTLTAGDTPITDGILKTGGLAPGASVRFLVRVYAPGGANIGDTATATVTVGDVDSGGNNTQDAPLGCGSQSITDTTTVVVGALSVLKKQALGASTCQASFPGTGWTTSNLKAAPGDCIYYEVVASNNGASPLTNVSIADAAANYTSLSTTPVVSCVAVGMSGNAVSASTSGVTVSCGSSANAISPGGTLTLRYAVQVQN